MQGSSLKLWWQANSVRCIAGFFAIALLASYLILPSLGSHIYASPDETAIAKSLNYLGSFQLPIIPEPLAVDFPWLHARSWVSHGANVVPVSFLGWPMLLAPIAALLGSSVFSSFSLLPWVGLVLLLSSFYPLHRLFRIHWSFEASLVGMVVMAASPMVIVYANRGLFPNVGLLVGAIWSVWSLQRSSIQHKQWWLSGLLCASVIVIRPIELIWILPWWIWAIQKGAAPFRGRGALPFFGGFVLPVMAFFFANHFVYGNWWRIGYWLHDNLIKNTKDVLSLNAQEQPGNTFPIFPFGIHPRAIFWNVISFTKVFLWPTVAILFSALIMYLRTLKKGSRSLRTLWSKNSILLASVWTMCVLLLVYGSGIYQDHIQVGAVTVGNSFLRYLLPLAPIAGMSAAYVFERWSRRSFVIDQLLLVAVVFVGLFGIYAAVFRDDESMLATRQELIRYATIMPATEANFPAGSVIVSARSDKIFAKSWRNVSPLPSTSEVARLIRSGQVPAVGLYARPLSQQQRDEWRQEGIEVFDVAAFGREHLYRLVLR